MMTLTKEDILFVCDVLSVPIGYPQLAILHLEVGLGDPVLFNIMCDLGDRRDPRVFEAVDEFLTDLTEDVALAALNVSTEHQTPLA